MEEEVPPSGTWGQPHIWGCSKIQTRKPVHNELAFSCDMGSSRWSGTWREGLHVHPNQCTVSSFSLPFPVKVLQGKGPGKVQKIEGPTVAPHNPDTLVLLARTPTRKRFLHVTAKQMFTVIFSTHARVQNAPTRCLPMLREAPEKLAFLKR